MTTYKKYSSRSAAYPVDASLVEVRGTELTTACKTLWKEVLLRAYRDVTNPAVGVNDRVDMDWFEDDSIFVGSFAYICEVLGLDKNHIRYKTRELVDGGGSIVGYRHKNNVHRRGGRDYVTVGYGANKIGVLMSHMTIKLRDTKARYIIVGDRKFYDLEDVLNIPLPQNRKPRRAG